MEFFCEQVKNGAWRGYSYPIGYLLISFDHHRPRSGLSGVRKSSGKWVKKRDYSFYWQYFAEISIADFDTSLPSIWTGSGKAGKICLFISNGRYSLQFCHRHCQ